MTTRSQSQLAEEVQTIVRATQEEFHQSVAQQLREQRQELQQQIKAYSEKGEEKWKVYETILQTISQQMEVLTRESVNKGESPPRSESEVEVSHHSNSTSELPAFVTSVSHVPAYLPSPNPVTSTLYSTQTIPLHQIANPIVHTTITNPYTHHLSATAPHYIPAQPPLYHSHNPGFPTQMNPNLNSLSAPSPTQSIQFHPYNSPNQAYSIPNHYPPPSFPPPPPHLVPSMIPPGISAPHRMYHPGHINESINLHDEPQAGHGGVTKTLQKAYKEFFWPGLKKDIQEYIASCPVCQACKFDHSKPHGLLQPLPIPVPSRILQKRKSLKKGRCVTEVLVQWEGQSTEEATWEKIYSFLKKYPHLEGKVVLQEEDNCKEQDDSTSQQKNKEEELVNQVKEQSVNNKEEIEPLKKIITYTRRKGKKKKEEDDNRNLVSALACIENSSSIGEREETKQMSLGLVNKEKNETGGMSNKVEWTSESRWMKGVEGSNESHMAIQNSCLPQLSGSNFKGQDEPTWQEIRPHMCERAKSAK